MKLLKEYTDLSDAENLSERLRRKGILTHVSSKNSKQLGSFQTGAVKVGVWAVLNEQENDAISLLTNKNHKVECQLSEKEMDSIEVKAKNNITGSTNKVLSTLAIGSVSIIIFVIMFNVLSNS
ncbi:MAG: hypothetical protein ACRBCS_15490 [Cellvibrionaceae bacterium]